MQAEYHLERKTGPYPACCSLSRCLCDQPVLLRNDYDAHLQLAMHRAESLHVAPHPPGLRRTIVDESMATRHWLFGAAILSIVTIGALTSTPHSCPSPVLPSDIPYGDLATVDCEDPQAHLPVEREHQPQPHSSRRLEPILNFQAWY
jgi:hypothetical protein